MIAERIRQRTDVALRRSIADFAGELSFLPLPGLMISEGAWTHVTSSDIDPKLVFAHPDLLRQNPRASEYYRGIALLPRKRVAEIAGAVDSWENEARRTTLREPHILRVAQLYNAVISSIIEGSNGWTLENGYRNIIANMGIGLDGTVRNLIGQDAERLGRVHTKRSASKMSANEMNPRKITSSFSKREKMRRNPFNRRNSLSISLRLLYISRSYSHG